MNRRLIRYIHRTVFLFAGIFLFSWLLSGVLMSMPNHWFGADPGFHNPPADWSRVTLSPADAIARATPDGNTAVSGVSLRQVNEHLLYSVITTDGKEHLVDAVSGAPFEFTPELAEALIRKGFGITAELERIEMLDKHNHSYSWGSLPAWRMNFRGENGVDYYLSPRELRMFRSSPVTRTRFAIMSLHEFEPVSLVTDNQRIRKYLLMLVGSIGLAGAVAGLLLLLPVKRS